jgi:hypothetical protein
LGELRGRRLPGEVLRAGEGLPVVEVTEADEGNRCLVGVESIWRVEEDEERVLCDDGKGGDRERGLTESEEVTAVLGNVGERVGVPLGEWSGVFPAAGVVWEVVGSGVNIGGVEREVTEVMGIDAVVVSAAGRGVAAAGGIDEESGVGVRRYDCNVCCCMSGGV